jgi:tetratricopeptide (TPR) repeat protein
MVVRRLANLLIEIEPLVLLVAVPILVLPASYIWRVERGLNAYDGLGDAALAWPSRLSFLALAAITVPWLVRWARDARLARPTPLDAPIALYVAAMALGVWASVDRARSLTALLGILGGVALCYGVWHWGSINPARRLWPLVGLLVLAGLVLSGLGYMQTDWKVAQERGATFLAPLHAQLLLLPTLGAKRLNPSVIGNTLLPLVPLAVVAIGAARSWAARLGLLAALVAMVGYLVASWSRGDLLALGLTLVLAVIWSRRWLREAALGLGVGVGAALVLALAFFPTTAAPATDLASDIYPSRMLVWTRALAIIGDHPFTGAGLDDFRPIARNSYPYFNRAFDQSEHAHSWPLQAGVDGGVAGLAAVLWLALAFHFTAETQRTPRSVENTMRGSAPSASLRSAFVAGFTAFFIGNLYDNGTMSGARGALVFWAFLGAALVALMPPERAASRAVADERAPAPLWRVPAAALCLVAGALMVWANWGTVLGLWHTNLASVARNQGLYTAVMDDAQRAALAAEAVAGYERAVGAAPDLAAPHRNLGILYWQAATPEQSARSISWTTALPIKPVAFFGGVPSPEDGYAAAARRELQQALELAPNDAVAAAMARFELGTAE